MATGANLLSNMDFSSAFRTRLFPRAVLVRGFCARFFFRFFFSGRFYILHRFGLMLRTLWMRARSRVRSFSADRTHVVISIGNDRDGLFHAHEFSSISRPLHRQPLISSTPLAEKAALAAR
jgi:hypothetical protein